MPNAPSNQNEIFASDLLSTQANALTLNGLTSDSFLRSDIDSWPILDKTITLGKENFKFKNIWLDNLNDLPCDYIMTRDKTNLPLVNSNGTTGFDLGGFNSYWRSIFSRNAYVDKLYVTDILKPDGAKFSHNDLTDIGTNSHYSIDSHISLTSLPHGATVTNTSNRLVSRDGSGNINVSIMYGTAVKAMYADIAEKYTSEIKNPPEGTVFSSSKNINYDVEICNEDKSMSVIGIYSIKPAFVMNENEDGICIGLKGKLNIRVIGPVEKGDILVSTKNGCARKAKINENIFKIAIANSTSYENCEKLIECII